MSFKRSGSARPLPTAGRAPPHFLSRSAEVASLSPWSQSASVSVTHPPLGDRDSEAGRTPGAAASQRPLEARGCGHRVPALEGLRSFQPLHGAQEPWAGTAPTRTANDDGARPAVLREKQGATCGFVRNLSPFAGDSPLSGPGHRHWPTWRRVRSASCRRPVPGLVPG